MLAFRSRFYVLETPEVLGSHRPSTDTRSAFGARHFQPHVTVLRKASGVDSDLTKAGRAFREAIPAVRFDRFVVRCKMTTELD